MGTKTASIVVDGVYSGGWDAGTWTDIDEGTDSPNDADVIQSYGAEFDDVEFTITMPGDFISMNSATIKLRGRSTGTKTYKKNLQYIRVSSPDESTFMFDIYSYSNPTFSTSWATYEIAVDVDPTVISNGINDKTTWDGAVVQIRANAESNGVCEISALQIDINYEGSGASTYNETGSGGIEGAGAAIESVDVATRVYDETASGGIVGGGVGSPHLLIVVDTSGDILAAGAAIESVDAASVVYDETASGGIVGGGDVNTPSEGGSVSESTTVTVDEDLDIVGWNISGGGSTAYAVLNEGVGSYNDSQFVYTGSGNINLALGLESVPDELISVTSVTFIFRARKYTNRQLQNFYLKTDYGDSENILIDSASYSVPSLTDAYTTYEIVGTPNEAYNSKANWNNAYVEFISSTTTGFVGISVVDIQIDYLAGGGKIYSLYSVMNNTAAGGGSVAGSADIGVVNAVDSSGGLLANGVANTEFSDLIEVFGGIESGGSSSFYVVKSNYIATGGIQLSGNVEEELIQPIVITGGIVCNGDSFKFTIAEKTGTGGCLLGGSSSLFVQNNIGSTGGIVSNGSGIVSVQTTFTGTFGAFLAGSASIGLTTNFGGIGGAELGGTATSTESDILPSSGGILGNASASVQYEANIVGNNEGSLLSGIGNSYVVDFFASSGGVVLAGSNMPCIMNFFDGDGGCLLGGLLDACVMSDIDTTGGVLISGIVVTGITVSGDGGALLGGNVDNCVMSDIIGSGGLVASGISNSEIDFEVISAIGGAVLSGRSSVDNMIEISGGITAGGLAVDEYVEFIILPEDTPGFKCQKGSIYTLPKKIKPVHSLNVEPKISKKYKPAWQYRNHRISGPAIVPAITVCNQKLYNKNLRRPQ